MKGNDPEIIVISLAELNSPSHSHLKLNRLRVNHLRMGADGLDWRL